MAAIGKIRSWGPALVGILALGLVGFIAQDGFSTCRGRAQMDSSIAGSIDGDKIDIQEYQTLVGEYQELLKFLGQGNFDEEQLNSLRDEVWNTCVLNKMVEKEAKELGLTVTDDEVVKVLQEGTHPAIMQNPLLSRLVDPQTRTLDINKVNMYRENMKAQAQTNAQAAEEYEAFTHSWALAEKMLAQNLLTNKYQMLLAGCVLSNPVSAKAAFDNQNIESQALVASMSYSQINDNDVEVSEADLKAKYEELKEGFKNYQDSRDIKFVSVQVAASQKDRDELMKVMNKAYAELQGDSLAVTEVIRTSQSNVSYLGLPVSRAALPVDLADSITKMSVGQVTAPFESRDNTFNVVKFLGKTNVADSIEFRFISLMGMNGAAASADSIVKAVNAGAPFDSIAKNYGQRAEKNWMRSTDFEQASTLSADDKLYFTTLLNSPVNEVKNLTLGQGNVVMQVTDRRGSVEKYDVAIVKRTIDFSNETYNEAYNKFSQFVSESQDLAGLQEKAAEYGYTVLDRTIRNTDHTIANIRSTHDALKWVFSEAEENQISQVYDRCGDNDRLLVVALSKVNPKGYESMASVEETLKQEVLIDKKYAKLAEKLANVKTIAEAKAQGARVDTVSHITFASPAYVPGAMSPEVALSGAVAGVEKGAVSKAPVKGRSGAYFFQVLDRAARAGVQFNAAQQQQMLSQQGMQQTVRMAMQELYNNLDIKDNRYIFF
jgi:peptidyl-prolyl cis-trans isomerase D